MVWNDNVRAALITLIQSIFPLLEITGVVHLTSDQVAAIMLVISNVITFLMLIIKKGQQPGDPVVSAKGSETAPISSVTLFDEDDGGGPAVRRSHDA